MLRSSESPWDLHVECALKVPLKENLDMVSDSVEHLRRNNIKVIFDAEHFFDGWKNAREYSLEVLEAACSAGAEWLVLCDTNGGTMTRDVRTAVMEVVDMFDTPLGIDVHNDCELAVANSLASVECGVSMVQGTINGFGERCGNANLCSVIPNLVLKMGRQVNISDLTGLTALADFVNETANLSADPRLPFVGKSAFAHKAGVHVSALMRDGRTYEHIDPSLVGNERRLLVSELSGTASILAKMKAFGIDGEKEGEEISSLE